MRHNGTVDQRHKARIASLALLALVVAPQATQAAGTTTGAMSVTATVLDSCSVIAAPLAFGSYSSTAAVLATSTLTIGGV